MNNILYADENKTMPILGGGIIFYRFNSNNRIELLLNKNLNAKYEDIGTQFDYNVNNNVNYFDIILQNLQFITNNIITSDCVLNYPLRNYSIYNKQLQYIVILIKANSNIKNINRQQFVNNEIDWISLYRLSSKNILQHSVHKRISSTKLIYKIKEIEYMHRFRLITKQMNISPTTSDDLSTDSN